MSFDKHWATTPAPRDQFVIISNSLDDLVGPDHVIRVINDLFDTLDWSRTRKGGTRQTTRQSL
jgi:hypothetical protein